MMGKKGESCDWAEAVEEEMGTTARRRARSIRMGGSVSGAMKIIGIDMNMG
jgi:hypothetical protein